MPVTPAPATESDTSVVPVLTEPQWVAAFMVLAIALSFIPFLIGFVIGLSVTNTSVFGAYALVSGVAADVVLRRAAGKILLVTRSPRVPFVLLWVGLCLYVIVVRPF